MVAKPGGVRGTEGGRGRGVRDTPGREPGPLRAGQDSGARGGGRAGPPQGDVGGAGDGCGGDGADGRPARGGRGGGVGGGLAGRRVQGVD
ncbi:MAG: hypothetical protein F4X60_07480, partial [Gemmatimonadetes bacterium]|nr:hypothetical protein [Gemmatimonadota bacterium]